MLGPSGCGKTTTLRMIAGFEAPTAGVIRLEDQDVSRVPPYKRNVNTVFQSYALVPAHVGVGQRRVRAQGQEGRGRRDQAARRRVARRGAADRLRPPQAESAVRRSAATGRARACARELPERAAARRTPGRTRPEVAPGDAARVEAHPARGRHHVRVRDPRPGRGAHDERPDRRDERGPRRADRRTPGDLRRARVGVRRRLHRRREPLPSFSRRPARAAMRRSTSRALGSPSRRLPTRRGWATRQRSWSGPNGYGSS